jgi:hypothetical protein
MALSKITTESLLDGEITAAKFASGATATLLTSTTVSGSAVTAITFTSLDLDAHLDYVIEVETLGAAGSNLFSIYANNDQTATNYRSQLQNGTGTTAGAEAANNARIGYSHDELRGKSVIHVGYSTGRYFMAISTMLRQTASTTFYSEISGVFKTAELSANLTRLDLVHSTSSGFEVGTKARIYRRQ